MHEVPRPRCRNDRRAARPARAGAAQRGPPGPHRGRTAELCAANPKDPEGDAKINFCHGFAQGAILVEQRRTEGKKLFCFPSPAPTRTATMGEFVAGSARRRSTGRRRRSRGCSSSWANAIRANKREAPGLIQAPGSRVARMRIRRLSNVHEPVFAHCPAWSDMRFSASLAKRSASRRSASLVSAVLAVSAILRSSAAFARSSVAVRWESGAVICIRVWASFGALGMHENPIRMVNCRIGRLPVGEGENFVGHLEQSARDRIVGRIREPSQVARQVRKVGSDIVHRSEPQ